MGEAVDAELRRAIEEMGYRTKRVESKALLRDAVKRAAWKAPLPDDAPEFFRKAFHTAREERRPIIVDFWASWCGPCVQLKKVTFASKTVTPLLKQCQVIFVDLDEHPKLGEFYGVTAVPDVFMINRDGLVVDRFQDFEPPERFRKRILELLASKTVRGDASIRLQGDDNERNPKED